MRMTRLPESVVEDPDLRDSVRVFRDRRQAGRELAGLVKTLELEHPVVLAIPSGGVPVGVEVALLLSAEFDLLPARKLQIPGNTEAGFGACTTRGPVFLNQDLVSALGLREKEIYQAEQTTRRELERREKVFRPGKQDPEIAGRDVVLVDDGLASGYTMIAAAAWAKEQRPARLVVAAPTGHLNTVARLSRHADFLVCPNIRSGHRFAVADAYEIWYDLDDDEVLEVLARMK